MSDHYSNQPGGTTDEIRRQGGEVVGQTQEDAEQVVRHAGEEAGQVIDTARREVRDVVDEATDAITREADERARQAGSALHDLGDDLHRMADNADGSTAAQYVDAIANSVDRLASTLEDGGSQGVIDSLRSTADRRPGSFITGAAMAGFVVGRMIRNSDTRQLRHTAFDTPSQQSHDDHEDDGIEIDLREPSPEPVQDYPSGLTTVGAGRPGTGSVPPPPPPSAPPERF